MVDREALTRAIAAQEAFRGIVPDEVVDVRDRCDEVSTRLGRGS